MWLSLWLVGEAEARRPKWEPSGEVVDAYNEGVDRLEAGDLVTAEQLFEQVLGSEPRCGMAQHALGMTRVRMNQPEAAVSVFVGALDDHGDQWEIQGGLAQAYFAAQDFDRARQHASEAVALQPDEVDAQRTLQLVLLRQGDIDAAATALQVAAPTLPGAERACLAVRLWSEAGDAERAAQWLEPCAESVRVDLIADARSAYATATGDHEALAQAASALGLAGMSEVVRASALLEAGEASDAAELCDRILAESPDAADARAIRASARWELGDREGAKKDLETLHHGGTWIDVAPTGAMSGIVTKAGEQKLLRTQARARGLLALVYLDEERADDAAAVLEGIGDAYLGEQVVGRAAVRLLLARAQLDDAVALLVQLDDAVLVAEVVAEHPDLLGDDRLAGISSSDDIGVRYNQVIARANGRDFAACFQEAEALLPELAGSSLAERSGDLLRTGHGCAAQAQDLEAAGRLLAQLDAANEAVQAGDLYNHAIAALKAADLETGASVLARVQTSDPELEAAVSATALWLAVETGDLETALVHAKRSDADPVTLLALASRLAQEGRESEAAELADRACPALAGDALQHCEELRAWLDAGG